MTGTTDVIPDSTAATPLLNDVTIGTSLIAEEDDETITVPVPVSTLSSTEFTGDVIPNATTRTKVDDEVITEGPSPGVTHATTVTRFSVDVTYDVTTLNIDDESDKTTNDIGNGFLTTDYPDENSLEEIDGRLVNTKDDHTVNLELKKDIYGNRIPENNDPNVSNYTRPLNGKEDDKDLSHVGLGISMNNGITIAGSQFDVSQNITAQPTNTVETGKERPKLGRRPPLYRPGLRTTPVSLLTGAGRFLITSFRRAPPEPRPKCDRVHFKQKIRSTPWRI